MRENLVLYLFSRLSAVPSPDGIELVSIRFEWIAITCHLLSPHDWGPAVRLHA